MIDWDFQRIIVIACGVVLLGCFLVALRRIINDENELDWADLVSSRGIDGKQYADWNKIGQGLGVALCMWLPSVYVYSKQMEATGLATVMGVSLLYLGGVSSYAATLRAKRGTVETTKVTEPAVGKTVTETKLQTPPLSEPTAS